MRAIRSRVSFWLLLYVLIYFENTSSFKTTVSTTLTKEVALEINLSQHTQHIQPHDDAEEIDVNYLQLYRPGRILKHKAVPLVSYATTKLDSEGAAAGAVRIFDNDNYEGEGSSVFYVRGEQCLDLPYEWRRKVVSIDSLGLCVLLWEFEGCNGSHRILRGDEEEKPHASRLRSGSFASLELC